MNVVAWNQMACGVFGGILSQIWAAFLVVSAILIVNGFVSGDKLKILGVPLMPWDVLLSKK